MNSESFRVFKYARMGVVLLSDHEIQDVPRDLCTVRKSLGQCGLTGVTIGKPAIDGSSLVTIHCVSKRCGSDPVAAKKLLDTKAERSREELNRPKQKPTADEHVEEWVGSSVSALSPDELQAAPNLGDGADLSVDHA